MSHNTWLHRAVRIAVRPLVASRVTPNQLTTLRLATGIAAAAAFAHGDDAWRWSGAGLFLLSMVLDRADGELARMSGKTSARGHTYDLVSDAISNALAFLGLGVGLREAAFGAWAPMMGLCAGMAIAAILLLIVRIEDRHGQRAGELGAVAGFDPDDAMALLPMAVWAGFAEWLLVAAAIGAPVFAFVMLAKVRGRWSGVGR